jgi:hypothetical protein
MTANLYYVGIFLGALVAFMAMPLLLIWSLNTLFNLGIVVSVSSWFAAMIIVGLLTSNLSLSR